MNAIAYIYVVASSSCSTGNSFAQQELVIRQYCNQHEITLLQVFHEDGCGVDIQGNAWTQVDDFLRKSRFKIDVLILNTLAQLGEDQTDISNKILFLREIYQVKVLCLDEQFVGRIVKIINGIKRLDVIKKQISELLLKYLITFKSKRVSFTIQGMADFCAMDSEFLLQPYETYQDLYDQSLLLKTFDLGRLGTDPDQYLSLLESTLRMLMSLYIIQSDYVILTAVIKPNDNAKLFAREFVVEFSDQFWTDFKAFV